MMNQHEQMNIVIVGHVDHGKSTVIGRMLADTDSLPQGKLQQIRDLCKRTSKPFEYAFLLDALKDEQAQGITIDAARVFFQSEKRHYIIIDAPGHIEFLKNMITGASRADAALLVIDANEGVQENSRRHGYMLGMLGIKKVAVLVNKMDLVDYSQQVFDKIQTEYSEFLSTIGMEAEHFLPVSGMQGDNIVEASPKMSWFDGQSVLEVLDGFMATPPDEKLPFRMPVQDTYKFTRFGDSRRIIAGTVATGSLKVGDKVVFYPSGKSSAVHSIETFPSSDKPFEGSVKSSDAVGFTLEEQLYITRGDLVARVEEPPPKVSSRLKVSLFWLGRASMTLDKEYFLRVGGTKVRVQLESITRLIDASNLDSSDDAIEIGRHDVAECILRCDEPIAFDLASDISETGR
ncbi:GTP-binding protein, partial [Myxococcota bacterium]|nr:GTP-binding protein [Myxococcota bacterium]